MTLPFTIDALVAVFTDWNPASWPLPVVTWLLGVAAAALSFLRHPATGESALAGPRCHRTLSSALTGPALVRGALDHAREQGYGVWQN